MGSASSLKLSDSVGLKTSSISQEFHHQRHSGKSRTQKRFSYCSPTSEPPSNNNNNNINYCNHIYDMAPRNASIYHKFSYANNNANCAIKNVQSNHNASNASTMLATNRFKSFENFMVSSSCKPLSSQLTEQRAPTEPRQLTSTEKSEDSQMSTGGKLSMTKSLIMYDVDFEKFNRMPDQAKPGAQVVTKRKSTAVKATMTASSSIYQDLIELDKDLEKRENHLIQQTSTTSSNKNNNINRNSSTSSSSSSSGCSSGASSLNVSRRKHSNSSLNKRIELSLHSVVPSISTQTNTTSSTGATFINTQDHSSDIPSTALSTFNINSQSNSASTKASPSLFTQSSSSSGTSCSNKSILSSSCSSFSSPTEYFSPNNSKSVLTYGSKVAPDSRAQNRRGLFNKTKSECIYNENNHNHSNHHYHHHHHQQQQHQIVHHRHPHHQRDIKEASFYMKNFNTVAEHLQDQSLVSRVCEAATNSKQQLKKSRDSGIIVDLFHLNGSMNNIKAKLSNAKLNLRNSFSVFNLKQSAKRKKEKQSIQKQNSAVSCSSISRLRSDSSDVYESAASADTNATDAADAESDTKNQLDEQTSQENEIRRVFETHSTDTTANITKTNTISSSINSFLSNLAINNTNNNNNNNCNLIKNSEKCLIRNNSNNLISIKNNLTQQQLHHHHHYQQQQQQTSHPSNTISYKQIEVTNISKESNLSDVDCSTSNQNRSSNIHSSLSLSSSNLIASNNSNQSNLTDNKNNRLTRFSNSVKINDNKNQQQHEQQLQQPSNQQQILSSNFIKRTITFHNTNSNTNENNRNYFRSVGVTPASSLSSSSNESKISNMNNSKIINNNSKSNSSFSCAVNNSNIINNSTSFSFSSINSSNSNSSSDTSYTNSKLVNSKSNNISFSKNQIDNNHNNPSQVPVIIEQNSRKIEPTGQLSHSTSVSSQKSAVLESDAAATTGSTVLPTHRHQKIVVQASTSDLLNCFAVYISEKCGHLINEPYVNPLTYMNSEIGKRVKFEPKETINWLRSADRALLVQGWQEIAFMNPVNVVFVYLLVRDTLQVVDVNSVYELQCNVMACLYLAFSYMGNEISYPLKPFLIEENRETFWQRTVDLMNNLSSCMLRINRDPRFFTELFYELKSYSLMIKSESVKIPLSISSSSTNLLHNININTNNANINNNNNNNNINNSSVISSSTNRKHHNSFKQLTDQINSIEIKIDAYTQQQQQQNKHKDEQISSKNITSHEKSSFNTFKPVLTTDIAKVRSGLYMMGLNESEKPLSSYCV